ncbi:uncharacterized protein LOC112502270 [Cynara cardunculus var. scolymus]|uniref:Uncharacterized protein n=1 Tax=Cynara cardunculus var. scolymus TaxID=59895 RepID=A0A103XCQ6_CYNCS|nr:uncharacterized protein LOC112502270 [Cynara cardunculus var. scolymus]KVH88307.1 hypothetical protein Ccrd_024160 [Cynara cardunculus var. scolymus]
MAKPQVFNVTNTTPPPIIMEHEQEGNDISGDYYNHHGEEDVSGNGCGCFHLFSYFDNHHRDGSETTAFIHRRSGETIEKESWLMIRFKSLKEFSEFVAGPGPRWKNFIRKFSKKPKKNSQFQYDQKSYALNFDDDGGGGDDGDGDLLPRSFSTRFAPPSRSMST